MFDIQTCPFKKVYVQKEEFFVYCPPYLHKRIFLFITMNLSIGYKKYLKIHNIFVSILKRPHGKSDKVLFDKLKTHTLAFVAGSIKVFFVEFHRETFARFVGLHRFFFAGFF